MLWFILIHFTPLDFSAVFWNPTSQSVDHWPAVTESPGSVLEMQNLRPYLQPTEWPTVCEDPQVICIYTQIWDSVL